MGYAFFLYNTRSNTIDKLYKITKFQINQQLISCKYDYLYIILYRQNNK